MKSIALLAAALCCAAQAVSVAAPLSFQQTLALAEREAPTLALTTARIEASRQAARSAGELPDPKLSVGLENVPISGPDRYRLTRDFMTMQRLGWMQEFPSRAKREARSAVAQARIARAEAERAVAQSLVLRETALAWIQRRAVERQLKQLQTLRDENRLLDAAVAAQLRGGKGMASDALMPRQEAAMLDEREDQLRAQLAQAGAALRRWVGEGAEASPSGELPAWPLEADGLQARLDRHPEFRVQEAMAQMLAAETREAEAMKRPDWALELGYQRRGARYGDMVSVMVSIDLPLFPESRQNPQIAAKRAEQQALDAEREALLREHQQLLVGELAELQRAERALQRARGELLALAEQRVELLSAAYRGGRGSLVELIAARRERAELLLKTLAMEADRDAIAARLHFSFDPSTHGDQP